MVQKSNQTFTYTHTHTYIYIYNQVNSNTYLSLSGLIVLPWLPGDPARRYSGIAGI